MKRYERPVLSPLSATFAEGLCGTGSGASAYDCATGTSIAGACATGFQVDGWCADGTAPAPVAECGAGSGVLGSAMCGFGQDPGSGGPSRCQTGNSPTP